jgi:copper(I)-binding protein
MTRFFLLALAAVATAPAITYPPAEKLVRVSEAVVLIPLRGSNVTAAYCVVTGLSDQTVKVGVKTFEAFKAVELHQTVEENGGQVSMHQVDNLDVGPHKTIELKRGGNHLMLFDPTRVLREHESLKARFDIAGRPLDVDFRVLSRDNYMKSKTKSLQAK